MSCDPVMLDNKVMAIVCSRGRRKPGVCSIAKCGIYTKYLCDYPASKGRTCDANLCSRHAVTVGIDRHYCPNCSEKDQA